MHAWHIERTIDSIQRTLPMIFQQLSIRPALEQELVQIVPETVARLQPYFQCTDSRFDELLAVGRSTLQMQTRIVRMPFVNVLELPSNGHSGRSTLTLLVHLTKQTNVLEEQGEAQPGTMTISRKSKAKKMLVRQSGEKTKWQCRWVLPQHLAAWFDGEIDKYKLPNC